jgi:hypothetical protein
MWQNAGLFILGMLAGAGSVLLAIRAFVRFVILPSETLWQGPSQSPGPAPHDFSAGLANQGPLRPR